MGGERVRIFLVGTGRVQKDNSKAQRPWIQFQEMEELERERGVQWKGYEESSTAGKTRTKEGDK